MFKGYAKVHVLNDDTKRMFESLKSLADVDVLVGVPDDQDSQRPISDKGVNDRSNNDGITNAELVYIHTHGARSSGMITEMNEAINNGASYKEAHSMYLHSHGSPIHRIPPRPIIEPAIEDPENQQEIINELKQAAEEALDGNSTSAEQHFTRAGLSGQNAARDWFTNPKNNWPPNSPLTIALKGSDRPLIDTAQMRKSITYVVRKKD